MTVGEKIRIMLLDHMDEQNLTEGQVALRIGISQGAVSDIVSGKTIEPKLSTTVSIATFLGYTLEALLEGADPKPSTSPQDSKSRISRYRKEARRKAGLE